MNSTEAAVQRLVAGHRDFLAFLERRLGSRAQAEDVLQDAFVRGLPRVGEVEPEAVSAGSTRCSATPSST